MEQQPAEAPKTVPSDIARRALEILKRGITEAAQEPKVTVHPTPPKAKVQPVPQPPANLFKLSVDDLLGKMPEQPTGPKPDPKPQQPAGPRLRTDLLGLPLEEESEPVTESPEVKAEPAAEQPTPKPIRVTRYPRRVRKGDVWALAKKMGRWLNDHGATVQPITVSKMHRALTLGRYSNWRGALDELLKRRVVRKVKGWHGGLLLIHPERLMADDLKETRREARKADRRKRHRPKTRWYIENVEGRQNAEDGERESAEGMEEPVEDGE